MSDAFLANSLANGLVQAADARALSSFHQHVLLDKPGQLPLFGKHRQESTDKLVVVVRPSTVVDLTYTSAMIVATLQG